MGFLKIKQEKQNRSEKGKQKKINPPKYNRRLS